MTELWSSTPPGVPSWGGGGPDSWHLGFNDTYLSSEFAYNVYENFVNLLTGKLGDHEVYDATVGGMNTL